MQLLEFMSRMELHVDFRPAVTDKEIDKVVHLANWTADFHLTALTFDQSALQEWRHRPNHECWVIEVSDRFGDYGITGALLFACQGGVLDVQAYMISCKVLGKNVEFRVMQQMIAIAKERGCRQLHLHYRKTQRNGVSADFVRKIGGERMKPEEGGFGAVLTVDELEQTLAVTGAGDERTLRLQQPANLHRLYAPDRSRTNLLAVWEDIRSNYCTSQQIVEGIRRHKQQARRQEDSYVAPRTPHEERMALIWEEVLSVKPIDIRSHFFELGGNSLLGTQLLSRVREAFGAELSLQALFQQPILQSFLEVVQEAAAAHEGRKEESLQRGEQLEGPLSYSQQSLWFLQQLEPDSPNYNMTLFVRLEGPLSVNGLVHCLHVIASRHDSLRTTFHLDGGHAVARIAELAEIPLELYQAQGLDTEKREHARSMVLELSRRPFRLEAEPPIKAALIQLHEQEHHLLLVMHHMISDGWSLRVIQQELQDHYRAYILQEATTSSELPIRYADYVRWQRSRLEGSHLQSTQLEYWRKRLDGIPPLLLLPTDRPRPAVQTFAGASSRQALPAELSRALYELCQREGVTLYMLLLTAFQVLLHRYTGQETIVVGSPVANRKRTELEGVIGYFVNMLALRADYSVPMSFREALQQTRTVAVEAFSNQDLPFEQLVEALNPERTLAASPVFQVTFALQQQPATRPTVGGLQMTFQELSNGTSKFDLSMAVDESEQGLQVDIDYNTDLYDPATIERMQAHYAELLQGVVQDCMERISHLPLLSQEEKQQYPLWNRTGVNEVLGRCVHELVSEEAQLRPEGLAVACGAEHMTYRMLNERANALAHYLLARGVDSSSIVAIYLNRSLDLAVAQLAVLKTGAAYMPIDPAYPSQRVSYMLQDAETHTVVTIEQLAEQLPQDGQAQAVCLDSQAAIHSYPVTSPSVASSLSDVAYVIYTSGSTGQPKGVEIRHGSLLNLVSWHRRTYEVGYDSRATLLAGTAFDASVWETWPYLTAGASLHVVEEETRLDSLRLCNWLVSARITHTFVPTPLAEALLAEEWPAGTALRYMLTGGDRLRVAPSAALPFLLVNHYGPTESTVVATSGVVQPGMEAAITIGHPIDNTEVYVLDDWMQRVPIGVRGELYIGGKGLARGYRNRTQLTEERFVAHPYRPGERLYRTGDICRQLADGSLEFVGRTDHQVKIRGYRIELGEIEAALSSHPGVRGCIVLVHEDGEGNRRLVGYVAGDSGLELQQVREGLKDRLPGYMIPAILITLEELPLTPNGKIDHRALPAPDFSAGSTAGVLPRTETEVLLSEIWKQVLGVSAVGVHDNFFALGGDSILSIQVVSRARQAGLMMTTKHMFQHQTIAELAGVAQTSKAVIAEQGVITGEVPLTPVQHWLLEQELHELDHWNMAMKLSLKQHMDPHLLEQSLLALLSHHDALRMCFSRSVAGWQQINAPASSEACGQLLQLADLRSLDAAGQESAVQQRSKQAQESLSLAQGRLVQAVLFRLDEAREELLLIIHHLVVDGVSWRILLEDLERVYHQLANGQPIQLAPKSASFRHWAYNLERWARNGALEAEQAYWLAVGEPRQETRQKSQQKSQQEPQQEVAAGSSLGAMPMVNRNTVASVGRVTVKLETEQTRQLLQEAPKAYRTQINDLLLTALAKAMNDWTGEDSLYVALEGHGREEVGEELDISRTVGWFTSIYPVRLELGDEGQPGDELKRVKEQLRGIPQRGIGYGLLRYLTEDAKWKQALASQCEPRISFNYLGQYDAILTDSSYMQLMQGGTGETRSPRGTRRYELDVYGMVFGGQLELTWEYSEALHDRQAIEGLAHRYMMHLQQYIAHCLSVEAGGYTPSDFPAARLHQQELDALCSNSASERSGGYAAIEDIYLLAPLQQGMLFHALYSPESPVYFEQAVMELTGKLQLPAWQQAWEHVVSRHAVLRTSFAWEGLREPHQIVHRQVQLEMELLDLRELPQEQQPQKLVELLSSDRSRGFDLTRSPMRWMLVQREEERWQLIWSFHHLLLDGWSVFAILRELCSIYGALVSGVKLPELSGSGTYRHYIQWTQAQDEESARGYWRQYLQGFAAPTALHIGGPSRMTEEQHDEVRICLSDELTSGLQHRARDRRMTMNMLIQAAWALLLHRYSGEEDVLFGATVSVRPPELAGIETTAGLFINSLPVRMRVPQQDELGGWLEGIRERQAEWLTYAHSPLPMVMDCSEVPGGQPLFETLLVFENYPVDTTSDPLEAAGLQAGKPDILERTTYPLTIIIIPGERLELRAVYDQRRYTSVAVERLLAHLQQLLSAIAITEPQHRLQQLPMLTQQEEQQLLTDFKVAACSPLATGETLLEMMDRQAASTPHAVALIDGHERLSYSELHSRANRLARHLQGLGVGPEALVGLCAQRSTELLVGVLGILKAGGAYVPLDPAYPQERLAFIIEDTGVQVLVTEQPVLDRLPENTAQRVLLDADWPMIEEHIDDPVESGVHGHHLAYIIYTSGSTGRPKGVALEHRNTAAFLQWCGSQFSREELAGVLASTSISFDLSVFEMFVPLVCGGTVIMAENALYLPTLPAANEVTLVNTVPTAMAELIRMNGVPASVLTVNLAGEQLPLTLARQVYAIGSIQRLYNLYGPSEDTTYSTCWLVEREGEAAPPIGRPIAGTSCYILDQWMRPVPVGVPGELYIAGEGLARCYLERPELTAERFVANPYARERKERMYRTGDLCRYREDGVIEYMGRIDHQVKLRGYRIELQEIDTVLSLHDDIQEAVVAVHENHAGTKQLVAYYVAVEGVKEQLTDELRAYLQEQLPEYMIPSIYMRLDQLPLTPNGKVDRKALPLPEAAAMQRSDYTAPSSEEERILCAIWEQVLGVERVGIHDGFFGLGGDSILSIQIMSRAGLAGLRLTPKQMFRYQTVAELAKVAEKTGSVSQRDQGIVTGEVPLTPIQQWFFESDLTAWKDWCQLVHLKVRQRIEPETLRQALSALLAHHDGLRLRFSSDETGWRQHHAEPDSIIPLSMIDLSLLSAVEQSAARQTAIAQGQDNLDLANGPLVWCIYFRNGDSGQADTLTVIAHHLVSDGISLRVLLEDLEAACRQIERQEAISLPPKQTSYQEWAKQLAAYALTEEAASERGYWLDPKRYAAAPLPADHDLGENSHASMERVSRSLTAEETRMLLHEVPSAYRTHINDVLLTALMQSVAGWTGQRSLLLNLEGHGREELVDGLELARTVGWFTSIYPVFLELGEATGTGAILKSVKEQLRSVPKHGIGYGILRYLSADPEMSGMAWDRPEAEIVFNYLGQFDQLIEGSDLFDSVELNQSIGGMRRHVLDIYGMVRAGKLQMVWEYSSHLHRRETMEQLAERFMSALRSLIAHCLSSEAGGITPSDFPQAAMTQDELDRLAAGTDGRSIEDIYPLAPTQHGMLFHVLHAPESGVYFENMTASLEGELEPSLFEQAWRQLVVRHAILRTAFIWRGVDHPHQVVYRKAELPFHYEDWRELPSAEQEQRLRQYVEQDKRRGFELEQAPLMRVALLATGERKHRIVWSFHHLLLDGWSVSLLLKELFELIECLDTGSSLPAAPLHAYGDYVEWLQQQDMSQADAYWQRQLTGFRSPTSLAISRRQPEGEEGYSEQRIELAAELTARLLQTTRSRQLTLNTLIQGIWSLVLHRYSGKDDVLFGATVSGRTADVPDIESMIGLFINTLPVRVRVNREERLFAWLWQLQDGQAEQRMFESTPLSRIQSLSELSNGIPLFDSIIVFENYPVDTAETGMDRLRLQAMETSEQTNYPLTLAVVPGDELSLRMLYASNQFDSQSVERLLGHVRTLLQHVASSSDETLLKELQLLSEAERVQQVEEWNRTASSYEAAGSVQELVERQAKRTPEAAAVVQGERTVTYRELDEQANELAQRLRRAGVKPGTPVAVCMERSAELIIAELGVLKAGSPYVPIDPAYPPGRIRYMLSDTQTAVVLTQAKLVGRLGELTGAAIWSLDTADAKEYAELGGRAMQGLEERLKEGLEEGRDDSRTFDNEYALKQVGTPESLAYIIYTSGSTGQPKGVEVSHRSLLNLIGWHQSAYEVSASDRATLLAGPAFDASVWEIWPYVTAGASVHIVEEELRLSPEELRDWLAATGVTLSFMPTPLAERMVELEWPEKVALRALLTGGDRLHRHPAQELPFALVNHYGPTENTVVATCAVVPNAAGQAEAPSIGRPIANTTCYILDEAMELVPVGVPGELYIGGGNLARGYWGRPELTEERFVANPYGAAGNERMYRTGDLCRYRADGEIDYLGRIDDQVSVRGFRVELGEIETVMARYDGVKEACVSARTEDSGQTRLTGYIVAIEGRAWQELEEGLRRHMKSWLPEYMIPGVVMQLEQLPMTANGKLDRKALPEPEQPGGGATYAPPRNELEQALCAIWEQVLGAQQVGIRDNFFELGGDSIMSIQVVAKARQAGVHLQPKMIFDYPVIAELAEAAGNGLSPLTEQGVITGEVPLTPIQRWFFEQDIADRHHWNQAMLLHLKRSLDRKLLEQALQQLTRHHDALRLRYTEGEEGWIQQLAPVTEADLPLSCVDLSALSPADQREWLEQEATRAQASLNLQQGPICRAVLFDLGAERGRRLLLAVHHLAVDGVSWRILLDDLEMLLEQLGSGENIQLPPKTTSYKSWSEQLVTYAQTDALSEELTYWLHVDEQAAVPLPIDQDAGGNTLASMEELTVFLTEEETSRLLREAPTAYRSDLMDLLLCALVSACCDWTGGRGLRVTLEGHGREDIIKHAAIDLSRTVGWFTSMYPVTLLRSESNQAHDQVKHIRQQLAKLPQRGIGYGLLRWLSNDERTIARLRNQVEPEVSFNYLGQFDPMLSASSWFEAAGESPGVVYGAGDRQHLLDIVGVVKEGRLGLTWAYSSSYHHRTTIEQLAAAYIQALQQLLLGSKDTERSEYTPEDFARTRLSQSTLDKIMSQVTQHNRRSQK
ncbi:non-ribosomal peptide synthase/polyketide synthase [Paenibacillus sp. SYP-B4298]|uniref:non-ribosomal peptide synthase/polyketide synthase n=1 Tax=Paenibacillus sp. SYP-B4298 TaxID=2996034 RepID=UPI0022DE3734|nr:non-ribosomal peptide synthase/polyketide synthase [Paenibacillus sp. SYP-B4298]